MMAGVSLDRDSPWVLFGLDLSNWVSVYRIGARQLLWDAVGGIRCRFEAPVAVTGAALPEPAVYSDWGPGDAPLSSCRWRAIVLPDDLVLERELVLPVSVEAGLESIVELELDAQSPFPAEDRVAGWRIVGREGETISVCIAVAARSSVDAYLQAQAAAVDGTAPEVWHLSQSGVPVIIAGYGEQAREIEYRNSLKRFGVGAAVVAVLIMLMLVVPVLAASLRAERAERLMDQVREDAADEMQLREQIARANSVLEELQLDVAAAPDPRSALNRLAADTPDSVYMSRIDLRGRALRLTGFALDAASYMQQLSEVDWLADVAAPTAFQRDPRTGLERFLLDMNLTARPASSDAAPALPAQP